MAAEQFVNWVALDADPRFQELHRRKSRPQWGMMAFSVIWFILLPIGAAKWPGLFKTQLWGVINFGLLFALSQFIVTWLIAYLCCRTASARFDPLTALKNPGIYSIPIGFLGVILGSLLWRRDRKAEEMWKELYVRQTTGIDAEPA